MGSLVLNADLYEDATRTFYAELEKRIGDTYQSYLNAAGSNNYCQITRHAGSEIPFTAELPFYKKVDGWKLSGNPKYEHFVGIPKSDLQNCIVVGSPEYLAAIERVINAKDKLDASKAQFVSEIEQFLSPEKTLSVYHGNLKNGNIPEEKLTVVTEGKVKWVTTGTYSNSFSISGRATYLKSGRYGNSRFEANEITPVRLDGSILMDRGKGKWTARLGVAVPNRWTGSGELPTRHSSGSLIWNGDSFRDVGTWGGLVVQK